MTQQIDRRTVVKGLGGTLVGLGGMTASVAGDTGSAAAAKSGRGQSNAKGLNTKNLSDAITVANGKAKVKGWARSSGKGEITVTTQNGKSTTYSARDFAEDINRGVEKGLWTVKKRAGELTFDLTEKGRQMISKHRKEFSPSHACDGKSGYEGDMLYLNDDAVDEIVLGMYGGAGVFEIAALIAGAIFGLSVGVVVIAAAGILIALGASALALENDGCGVKINLDTNTVTDQACDC